MKNKRYRLTSSDYIELLFCFHVESESVEIGLTLWNKSKKGNGYEANKNHTFVWFLNAFQFSISEHIFNCFPVLSWNFSENYTFANVNTKGYSYVVENIVSQLDMFLGTQIHSKYFTLEKKKQVTTFPQSFFAEFASFNKKVE